jgi:hypothetical protein
VRAIQHAGYLRRHCDAYAEANPLQLRPQFDSATQAHLVYLEGRKPPLYLGLLLGEVIHDLRSALDHVAWRLAIQETGFEVVSDPRVAPSIQFPICRTRAVFDKHRSIRYFSKEAVTIIEQFQPYHNVGSHLVNPLAFVQHLSNADKHQALTPSLGQVREADIVLRSPPALSYHQVELLVPANTILDPATPFMRVRVAEGTRLEFEPIRVHVCFGTDITGQPDVIFPDKIEGVCMQIPDVIEALAALFPAIDYTVRRHSWFTPEL